MSTSKPTTKKATKKRVAKASRGPSGTARPTNADVLALDDFESQIQKFYGMSKKQAVETAKKAGILTPSGRLSGTYK